MAMRLLYDKFSPQEHIRAQFAQQATIPISAIESSVIDSTSATDSSTHGSLIPENKRKKYITRASAVFLVAFLGTLLYITWQPFSANNNVQGAAKQSFIPTHTSISTTAQTSAATGNTIQTYIVGAIKQPGIYTLPADARIYQLLQAAGGPMPNANLVALNLAARLHDGQEIYVATIGEKMPSSISSTDSTASQTDLVNINTTTATELVQQLHISSATANTIVSYRAQHGLYESVAQLAAVISKTIYDKIKDKVTI